MASYTAEALNDPSKFFKVQLYTGNGSANHAISFDDTDTDMQPDLVWIKNRDAADSHCIFDAARGVTKVLHSDDPDTVEQTDTDTLDSFASDGFQVDADVKVNTNTEDYVAWCWNTQGGAGSSNTTGTINTTTTSVGATQGFSISTYTGTGSAGNIGHGLGTAPSFIIYKTINGTHWWGVYLKSGPTVITGYDSLLYLNSTNAVAASQEVGIAPTSSVIAFSDNEQINNSSSENYVMYAWAEKQGFSKFGSYIGNGSADGPFIYTGFAPSYVMRKFAIGSTGNWLIQDWERFDKRNTAQAARNLAADNAGAEPSAGSATDPASGVASNSEIDFLSNGFKIRSTYAPGNGNGHTYIYVAFAEAPFVNSNGVPCTAR